MKYRTFFALTSIQNANYHCVGKSKKKLDLYVEINPEYNSQCGQAWHENVKSLTDHANICTTW